jgi:hypothetical protein
MGCGFVHLRSAKQRGFCATLSSDSAALSFSKRPSTTPFRASGDWHEPVGLGAFRTFTLSWFGRPSSTAGSSSTIFINAMAIGLNPRLYTLSTAKCHRLVAIRTFVILR